MAFEFTEIGDPVYRATCTDRGQEDYLLVRPTDFSSVPVTLPSWSPEPCCLNKRFTGYAELFKNLEVRPDDVWLVTYPKSGTTWCQEMIWLVCNDLDYEQASEISLAKRFPFVDMTALRDLPEGKDPFEDTLAMPSPRFIKSHLPVALLPEQLWTTKPRLVYVRRNPKAVAVSYYHHSVMFHNYKGTMEQFVESFVKDLEYYSPYHRHVLEFHNLDYGNNLLHLCYEDMKTDLKATLRKVCQFFGKSYSEEQLDKLESHLSFDSMKNNKAVNVQDWVEFQLQATNRTDRLGDQNYRFMRRGESNGWRSELSAELVRQLNEWNERKVAECGQGELFSYKE
ncbi:sulfotransferase 1A1 [Culex quinquefasciatus]|uniref:Sulfotransferase 1A1 n=1 Tax=Culex quinquefasciatus TaxID=7176 RepID=B0X8H7_CULQU|nr:sulfotransferase 1A1 [Culex quinquefasciatus]|eukprot:XP_001865949.1 sulfotransferase 1A1 [Culex quinquefasciatus]